MSSVIQKAKLAKKASLILANTAAKQKNKALQEMAKALIKNTNKILTANKKYIKSAEKLLKQTKLTKELYDRLKHDK